jgi:uncharacterized membrane protein
MENNTKAELKNPIKAFISKFRIPIERQQTVLDQIRGHAKGDFDFYVLLILGAIIITLGLIINSGAVVIGGMLVTPLVWPILAVSLSIIRGSARMLQTSIITLINLDLKYFPELNQQYLNY